MFHKNNSFAISTAFLLMGLCILLSGCTPQVEVSPAPAASQTPASENTQTSPMAQVSLAAGDLYFSLNGHPGPIFMRNVTGIQYSDFETVLELMQKGGSKLARIQLDSLGMGYTTTGEIDEAWVKKWERVFDRAQADGIYVMPVFSGWFDWNNGTPDYDYSVWKSNPLNVALGGPAKTPGELFKKGSATQELWLAWVRDLVTRWQERPVIVAWEIFSEVNIASGVDEAQGVAFIEDAALIIRDADKQDRPVTASLADGNEWRSFYRSKAIDFINIHPYPTSGQLDRYIIQSVHQKIATYGKPVLIGEAGLSAIAPDRNSSTLTTAEGAPTGIRHAIWAGLVSGAMNGRGLYWEDSYAIYFPELGIPFIRKYGGFDLAPSRFAAGMDFSGFRPKEVTLSSGVMGAVIGDENAAVGWMRDAECEPPDWKLRESVTGQSVVVSLPGESSSWQVDFYDTNTGDRIVSSARFPRHEGVVVILLPDFHDDIAFKMIAQN